MLQGENTSATKSTKGQSVTSTHVQDIDEEAYYFVHAFLDFMNWSHLNLGTMWLQGQIAKVKPSIEAQLLDSIDVRFHLHVKCWCNLNYVCFGQIRKKIVL